VMLSFSNYINVITEHCPLRFTDAERQVWRILESALEVSEYTDKIDVIRGGQNKARLKVEQIQYLCHIISGLIVSHSYERGQKLSARLLENGSIYQNIFELGRRMKITNPKSMRTTYGKLMWMLMDANERVAVNALGFDCTA